MTDKIGIFKYGPTAFITVRGNSANGTFCRTDTGIPAVSQYRLKYFTGSKRSMIAPAALSKWTT